MFRSHLVDINDLVLALRRLQKVPNDTKFQKIMRVLDEDKDGIIDANDALRVSNKAILCIIILFCRFMLSLVRVIILILTQLLLLLNYFLLVIIFILIQLLLLLNYFFISYYFHINSIIIMTKLFFY